jgi:predicted nucleic acid-binding protein
MKYVLDASVSMRTVVPDALTSKAQKLLDDYAQQIHELIAPSVYPAEIASALTKTERQKYIQVGEARKFFIALLHTPPVLHDIDAIMLDAIDISSRTRCGLYDALYIRLAEREGCEFVTADKKCLNALQRHFTFISDLATFP